MEIAWINNIATVLAGDGGVALSLGALFLLFMVWKTKVDEDRKKFEQQIAEYRDSTKERIEITEKQIAADRKEFNEYMRATDARIDKQIAVDRERTDKLIAEMRKELREYRRATDARGDSALHGLPPPSSLPSSSNTIEENSPTVMSDKGEQLATGIGALAWAEKLVSDVEDEVAGKPPSVIQEKCLYHVVYDFKPTEEEYLKIGEAAYEHGITRLEVLQILGLAMRDVLLERNGHPVPKRKSDSESK